MDATEDRLRARGSSQAGMRQRKGRAWEPSWVGAAVVVAQSRRRQAGRQAGCRAIGTGDRQAGRVGRVAGCDRSFSLKLTASEEAPGLSERGAKRGHETATEQTFWK